MDISVLAALALFAVGAVATFAVIGARRRDDQAEVNTRLLAAYREEAELEKSKRLDLEAQVNLMLSGFLEKLMVHVGEKVAQAVREELRDERRART